MSSKLHDDMNKMFKGVKSISESDGSLKDKFEKQTVNLDSIRQQLNEFKIPLELKQQADIELSYINAAIELAKGSNEIGAGIHIGLMTVGVSLNERLIPILKAEAEEIKKFLRGEANHYE